MKSIKLTYLLILINFLIGITAFTSCSDDDNLDLDYMNSSLRLLPNKMSVEYADGQKRIFDYRYDDNNRLIAYTETSHFGKNMSLEDMETTCKITYDTNGEIDSLIIVPRLLDLEKSKTVGEEIYPLVNDTILFKHQGDLIAVKNKKKQNEYIYIDSNNRVNAYKYKTADNQSSVTNTFEYDAKGNITKSSIDGEISNTDDNSSPYSYIYDKRNGVFTNINSPQWFLVIMLNLEFNLVNNNQEFMDSENGRWEIKYEYNEDDYPTYWTSHAEETPRLSTFNVTNTSVEYIRAQ